MVIMAHVVENSVTQAVRTTARARVSTGLELRAFAAQHAPVVASWVRDAAELQWLAPATTFPLTAEKVLGWTSLRGQAYVLSPIQGEAVLAYGELNPLAAEPRDLWLGHLVVDPRQRGKGLGGRLLAALLEHGIMHGARRLVLVVFPENIPAIRCYIRAGFRLKGPEEHRHAVTGARYSLLRFEFEPS
jgi:ribosomal protein S18 acetylase RimI-like enzyme